MYMVFQAALESKFYIGRTPVSFLPSTILAIIRNTCSNPNHPPGPHSVPSQPEIILDPASVKLIAEVACSTTIAQTMHVSLLFLFRHPPTSLSPPPVPGWPQQEDLCIRACSLCKVLPVFPASVAGSEREALAYTRQTFIISIMRWDVDVPLRGDL